LCFTGACAPNGRTSWAGPSLNTRMEIPGLYSPKAKLDVSSFFESRQRAIEKGRGVRQTTEIGSWQTWNSTECAHFIVDVCQLPQYFDVAERALSGPYMNELLQAGLLSKGLAKIGIGDFEHVRRITTAIQSLDSETCVRVSLSARRPPSRGAPARADSKLLPNSAPARQQQTLTSGRSPSPRKSPRKPKLLENVCDGFQRSLPEYQRRLVSPRPMKLPTLTTTTWTVRLPNACPVEVPISSKPINYLFDGCHSPTVTHLRKGLLNKAASEAAIRSPYWTTGRSSPEPWGGVRALSPFRNEGISELVRTRYP